MVGSEITKEKMGTHESLIEVEKDGGNDNSILEVKYEASLECYSTVKKYCLEMRLFMCSRIYNFFKNIKFEKIIILKLHKTHKNQSRERLPIF